MTRPNWPSIKSEYVETTLTLAEVQAKWSVPRGTLSARATREKWHDEKQQFAAQLEKRRRENILAKRAAEQEQFESVVFKLASRQLMTIARLQDEPADVVKTLKLATALEKVQRISRSAFGN
ncbi:MAG: hypothetical protein Q8N44_20120 [Rubrivivax sp.]|nr:hypothetical protein [Rubrivivax sp.]